jgi:O-antigen/teichoic acid export membrane protein
LTSTVRREESVAAHGARWMTLAMVLIGLLNYGYALLLTHLLDVAEYSKFAAGQGLLLWASTVSTVSVPWVLAQALIRARLDVERNSAIRFAKLTSSVSGLVAAVVVGAVATRFADSATALVLALSTFVIFLAATTAGWLQGQQRMQALSALYVADNVVKNTAGILLVVVVGLGDTGALAAFGIGALLSLVWWPRTPHGGTRSWLAALANRGLWRRAVAIAGAQGVVSLFVAIDVVLVAVLPGNRALTASYQASAALSRVPFYVASAVAIAFFPSLSRRAAAGAIAARALRMYAAVAVPLAVILSTIPAPVLARVFPTQYTAVATLLKYTAVTGLMAGGISLVTAFFQAADDYSCLWWLAAGLTGYIGALLAGWRVDGITGLAAGGALGASTAMVLAGWQLARRQGRGVFALVPFAEPVIAAAFLIILRPHVLPWLAAATLVGLRAAVRFVRPGARHARRPRWAALGQGGSEEQSAVSLLTDTVWRGTVSKATDADVHHALVLARQNRVEGRLARAYPTQLPDVLAEVNVAAELFAHNFHQVMGRLNRVGISAVLIPVGQPGDHVGSSIDLIVLQRQWRNAFTALAGWYVQSSIYELEHSTTALLYPSSGPGVHLHTSVSWFGIPMLPTDRLLSRARRNLDGFLIPAAADYLRIRLAQAIFQDLSLDLSKLLSLSSLLHLGVIAPARTEANREGWRREFDGALTAASGAIDRLDRGLPVGLPVPVPVFQSLPPRMGHHHQRHQMHVPALAGRSVQLRVMPSVTKKESVLRWLVAWWGRFRSPGNGRSASKMQPQGLEPGMW